MPLHPQVRTIMDQMTTAGPPLHHLSPAEARKAVLAMRATQGEPERVAKVEDLSFRGPAAELPLRIYTPDGRGPFPVLVYFHGGGWVVGNIETVDASCRSLANLAGCMVVSADYRLAPEHKFPAAADDCYAATRWVALHAASFYGDPARLAVGGESAGANLAAVAALMAQERGAPSLVHQLLAYPVLNSDEARAGTKAIKEWFLLVDLMKRKHQALHQKLTRGTAEALPPDARRRAAETGTFATSSSQTITAPARVVCRSLR